MPVRYYSSLDTGAPALPSTSGQRMIDNFKLVLMACLVNGYGSKPGAGWTIGHEHADGFSLFNGEGYINFVSISQYVVAVYLMETLINTSAALATGDNRRSGPWYEGQAETGRQYVYFARFAAQVTNKQWCVVADDKTVIFSFSGSSTAVDRAYGDGTALYFGRYYPAIGGNGFCAIGGGINQSTTPYFANSAAVGTSLRNPFDGTTVQGAAPYYHPGLARETYNSVPYNKSRLSPALLRPVRASLMCKGLGLSGATNDTVNAHGGLLRGLVADPALVDVYPSKVFPLLGIASPTYQDHIKPITLPNGKQWVPVYCHTSELGAFVSLDAADW